MFIEELLQGDPELIKVFNEMNYLNHSPDILEEVKVSKEKLEEFHQGKLGKIPTKKQGDLLENYMLNMIKTVKIFDVIPNKQTTGNEIDIIVKLNKFGKFLRATRMIPNWIEDCIIIECKNYTGNVGITYINKFHSLMSVTGVRLGFFVTYNGIAGKNKAGWQDAYGLIKKINLMNCANLEKPFIIDMDKDKFRLYHDVYECDFIEWLSRLKSDLILDLDKNTYILNNPFKHDKENQILDILKKTAE